MSVSLKFHDKKDYTTIECIANTYLNSLFIDIESDEDVLCIELDKETAIKLSKELRKQIALLD